MVLLCNCHDGYVEHDGFIEIYNNSEQDIVWLQRSYSTANDTATLSESTPWRNMESYVITSGDSYVQDFNISNFQYILKEGWFQYYLFNYDSLINITWERIRDENIILKKVYFETWEDMEACNFTITYP